MTDQPQHAPEGAPEWMVSYADMITIIMAFFVVLYATTGTSGSRDRGGKATDIPKGGREATLGHDVVRDPSLVNNEAKEGKESKDAKAASTARMQRVFESLNARFGPEWTAANCWTGGPSVTKLSPEGAGSPPGKRAPRGKRTFPGTGRGDSSAVLYVAKPDDTLITGGRVLFAGSSEALEPDQKQQLVTLAAKLAGKLQKIELRGHTGSEALPADGPFHDHNDLAYARCCAVRDYLASLGIEPRRMRLAVSGDNEPLDTTGDPVRSRQNSRVDVHWLNEWLSSATSAKPPAKTP